MSDKQSRWDYRFLRLAEHVAGWSKDPSTKVGAVIVDTERRVLGLGYNGFPRLVRDDSERLKTREVKYALIVHAELNAILNAVGSVRGCTLYTWPFLTCHECSKLVVQAGIVRVIAPKLKDNALELRWAESLGWARTIYKEAQVSISLIDYEQFSLVDWDS